MEGKANDKVHVTLADGGFDALLPFRLVGTRASQTS